MSGIEERLKILVVEDAEAMRHHVSQSLRVLGYAQITGVSNGQAALEYLQTNRVDLIIADWYMDGMNGLELLRHVRSSEQFQSVMFIILSGETAKEKVLHAIKMGIDAYIIKPFTVTALGLKIYEALKRRGVMA